MPDDAPPLRPADRADLLLSLSYALRHGRSASRQERDDLVARLAAEPAMTAEQPLNPNRHPPRPFGTLGSAAA